MPLSPSTQTIIDAFGQQHRVKPERLENLRHAIESAPALVEQINQAVAQEKLRHIAPLRDPHAGGVYLSSRREMQIPLTALDALPGAPFTSATLIFTLGHELQHAIDADTLKQTHDQLLLDCSAIAQASFQHEHDYTAPIAAYLARMRKLEAGAEISAWNATVSTLYARGANGDPQAPSFKSIYTWHPGGMHKFIDVDRSRYPATYALKPNLEVDARQHMATSDRNLEGMGRNYVDRSSRLGHHGNSDYANFYGARAIGGAARAERHAHPDGPDRGIRIDLAKLKLSPRILAENGIGLGKNTAPMPYVDRSLDPPTRALFWHTARSHIYPPSLASLEANLEERGHPDNALYQSTLLAMRRMHEAQGTPPLPSDKNLAAALVVSARRDGMSAIHRVVMQEDRVFGVQDPPMKKTIEVHRDTAERTSLKSSTEELRRWRRQQNLHGGQHQPNQPATAAASRKMPCR